MKVIGYVGTGLLVGIGLVALLADSIAAPGTSARAPTPGVATPSPPASPIATLLTVHVTAVFCRVSLDPGIPLAVAGREATLEYLLGLGCEPQAGVVVGAASDKCVTSAEGQCLLHVAPTGSVQVTEVRVPVGTQPLVKSLSVPLQTDDSSSAIFVNVPLTR